jgi:hypothetical protein
MSSLPHPPAPGPSQADSVAGQRPATIHLYTAGTPNGYKASITLEELRAAYPEDAKTRLSYDVAYLSLWQNEQKVRRRAEWRPRYESKYPALTRLSQTRAQSELVAFDALRCPALVLTPAPRLPQDQPQRPHPRDHRRQPQGPQRLRVGVRPAVARRELRPRLQALVQGPG